MVERPPLMGAFSATEPRLPSWTSLLTSCKKPLSCRGMAPGPSAVGGAHHVQIARVGSGVADVKHDALGQSPLDGQHVGLHDAVAVVGIDGVAALEIGRASAVTAAREGATN